MIFSSWLNSFTNSAAAAAACCCTGVVVVVFRFFVVVAACVWLLFLLFVPHSSTFVKVFPVWFVVMLGLGYFHNYTYFFSSLLHHTRARVPFERKESKTWLGGGRRRSKFGSVPQFFPPFKLRAIPLYTSPTVHNFFLHALLQLTIDLNYRWLEWNGSKKFFLLRPLTFVLSLSLLIRNCCKHTPIVVFSSVQVTLMCF